MEEYILEMTGITKRFPGVLALDQAWLRLKKGEVREVPQKVLKEQLGSRFEL